MYTYVCVCAGNKRRGKRGAEGCNTWPGVDTITPNSPPPASRAKSSFSLAPAVLAYIYVLSTVATKHAAQPHLLLACSLSLCVLQEHDDLPGSQTLTAPPCSPHTSPRCLATFHSHHRRPLPLILLLTLVMHHHLFSRLFPYSPPPPPSFFFLFTLLCFCCCCCFLSLSRFHVRVNGKWVQKGVKKKRKKNKSMHTGVLCE